MGNVLEIHPVMSKVIPGTHGTSLNTPGKHPGTLTLCTWFLPVTSQDVPGNPRDTWDIWDMGQGCVADS